MGLNEIGWIDMGWDFKVERDFQGRIVCVFVRPEMPRLFR